MKIAFLFLTIDNVRFPEIWEYYFKNNKDKFNIYCHPKDPNKVTVPWQKKNIIKKLTPTKWGFLVQATINLLHSALQNKDNYKFILVSESCLPVKSFNLLYNFLKKDDIKTSYIDLYHRDIKLENFKKIPISQFSIEIRKHSQWFCLSRYHSKKLLMNPELHKFKKVIAGDENILSLIVNEKNIKVFKMTFANWAENEKENKIKIKEIRKKIKDYFIKKEKYNTNKYDLKIKHLRRKKQYLYSLGSHPKTYDKVSKDVLKEIKESESFFYRKFSADSNIIKYYKEIL